MSVWHEALLHHVENEGTTAMEVVIMEDISSMN